MAQHDPEKLTEWLYEHGFEESRRADELRRNDCPLCSGEKADKVWANIESGLVNCYSCGGRSAFNFVMEVEGITFREALAIIGQDTQARARADGAEEVFRPAPPVPPGKTFQTPDSTGIVWLAPDSQLSGWAYDAIAATMARGFTWDWLIAKRVGLGLCGRFERRVIIPVFYQGHLIWWQAWDWTRTSDIKYDSPWVPEDAVGRRDCFYQWDLYGACETVVLAEGQFNAWASEMVGWPSIASFGKGLSPEQLSLLMASPIDTIILALDPDAHIEATRLADTLTGVGKRVVFPQWPSLADMNDLGVEQRRAALVRASSPDWFFDATPG